MKITIKVDRDFALIAIGYVLYLGFKITSKTAFNKELRWYVELYGRSCLDDHEGEVIPHRLKAETLVEKYFK